MVECNIASAAESATRTDEQISGKTEHLANIQRDTALADYSALLAIFFQYPTQSLIDGLASGTLLSDFDSIAHEIGLPDPSQQNGLKQLSVCQRSFSLLEDAHHAARREYTRLFNHPDHPAIYLYEGLFVDKKRVDSGKRSMNPRMFINPAALDAERCYRKLGLKRNTDINIPADCMTTELDYLSAAYRMRAETTLHGDVDRVSEIHEAISEFLRLHVEKWFACFFEHCIRESKLDIYRAAGTLGLIYTDALSPA